MKLDLRQVRYYAGLTTETKEPLWNRALGSPFLFNLTFRKYRHAGCSHDAGILQISCKIIITSGILREKVVVPGEVPNAGVVGSNLTGILYTLREGHISHIKSRKNLFSFVAHRRPVPKSPFQMVVKFKRPCVFCSLHSS